MPKWKDPRKLITVKIPSQEGSEVKIREGLFTGQYEKLTQEAETGVGQLIFAVAAMMEDWNLTDDEGKKLPITAENIRTKLLISDLNHILSKVRTDFFGVGRAGREK